MTSRMTESESESEYISGQIHSSWFFVVTRRMIKTNVHEGRRCGVSTVRAVKITDSWNSVVLDTQQVASRPGLEAAGVHIERQPIVCTDEHHHNTDGGDPVPSVFWIGRAARRLVSGTGAQRHHRCSQLNSPGSLWLSPCVQGTGGGT